MCWQLPTGKYITLPENYKSYGLFIPVNKEGRANPFKEYIVKYLLTLAERIAEF